MTSFKEYIEVTSRFGRYQLLQLVLCFLVILSTASQNLAIIFTGQIPSFLCGTESSNSSDIVNINSTDVCLANGTCPQLKFTEEMQTLVSKYNLVCDRSFMLPLISTTYMIGFFGGSPAYGYLSDRFGRLNGILLSGLQTFVCALISALAPNYITYVVFSTLKGFGASGIVSVAYTYIGECCSANNRAIILTLMALPWTSCYFVLTASFYLLQNQTHVELILACLHLTTVLLFFLCVESPRWLVAKHRFSEAKTAIERIIQRNQWVLDDTRNEMEGWLESSESDDKKATEVSFKTFFTNPVLRRISLITWFATFSVSITYYGFVYGTTSLKAWSIYKQVLVVAAIEFLCKIFLIPVIKWSERLWLTMTCFLIISVFAFTISGVVSDLQDSLTVTILCVVARPVVSFLFNAETLYCTEVYPTTHRNFGIGCASAAARIGGICASQMITLGKFWPSAPYVIYGTFSILMVVLKCFMPETKYQPCPENVTETEELMKRYNFISRISCRNRNEGGSANFKMSTGKKAEG